MARPELDGPRQECSASKVEAEYMREKDEAPLSLKLVHRRNDSNLAGHEGSQLGKSSINALPNKDTREHAHMAPTMLSQCSSDTKPSRRERERERDVCDKTSRGRESK